MTVIRYSAASRWYLKRFVSPLCDRKGGSEFPLSNQVTQSQTVGPLIDCWIILPGVTRAQLLKDVGGDLLGLPEILSFLASL